MLEIVMRITIVTVSWKLVQIHGSASIEYCVANDRGLDLGFSYHRITLEIMFQRVLKCIHSLLERNFAVLNTRPVYLTPDYRHSLGYRLIIEYHLHNS